MVVYLTDQRIKYEEAQQYFTDAYVWAKNNCSSFIDFHVQDVSDVSYIYDHVAEYKFADPKDAMWFQLKWKTD